jgi:hypothetical protein
MDAWNINVSAGVISLAVSFSRRAGILSGTVALRGFKLVKSFMTPLWWIIIGGISGVELTPISGMLLRSSDVRKYTTGTIPYILVDMYPDPIR